MDLHVAGLGGLLVAGDLLDGLQAYGMFGDHKAGTDGYARGALPAIQRVRGAELVFVAAQAVGSMILVVVAAGGVGATQVAIAAGPS